MSKAIPARVEYNKMGICCIPKFRSDGVKLMAYLESPHQIDTKILKKINAPKCSLTSVIFKLKPRTRLLMLSALGCVEFLQILRDSFQWNLVKFRIRRTNL